MPLFEQDRERLRGLDQGTNFKHKRRQSNMGTVEKMAFLTYLAVERSVARSMLAKAKSAILCLYRVRSNLVCTHFSARAVMPV